MNEKLNELKALIVEADKAQETYLKFDEIDESKSDEAYEEYWIHLKKIASLIRGLINVDENTALRMAIHKKDEIVKLLERAA